jgi:hypothetical protein
MQGLFKPFSSFSDWPEAHPEKKTQTSKTKLKSKKFLIMDFFEKIYEFAGFDSWFSFSAFKTQLSCDSRSFSKLIILS